MAETIWTTEDLPKNVAELHEMLHTMAERIADLEAMVVKKEEKIKELENFNNDLCYQSSEYRERFEKLEDALRIIREQVSFVA